MTARLAYKASRQHPNSSPLVNKFDPDALDGFRALPDAWQRAVLRACGGAGDESDDALALSLSPPPELPEIARIGRAILARPVDRRRRGDGLSHREKAVLDAAVDAEIEHRSAQTEWEAAAVLRPLAEAVAERTANLALIDPTALRLLTATDEDLLAEAERIADANWARHESRVKRGLSGIHPRDRDARAIRRRLRRRIGRAAAWAAGILRLIGGRPEFGLPAYADDWSLRRWRQIQERSRAYLAEHVARSESGESVPMLDVAAAAARGRAAMWYAIILGMRERARRDGRVPIFVTATLPPEWHPNPTRGSCRYDPSRSPTAAARELAARWHRAICLAREHGVAPYGVRTVEPHADGTPHLHACLWVRPEHRTALERCLRKHWPADGGSADTALKVKRWESRESRASRGAAGSDPVSYVMTYVFKTLTAADEESEADDTDRARAWASHVGLRRLALVGLATGTLGRWRAIHKAMRDADRAGERIGCARTRAIAHAMRRRQWATALALLGALAAEPRLAAWRRERVDCWGDVTRETAGYYHPATGEIVAETRPIRWEIVRADADKPLKRNGLSIVVSSPRVAPWARPGPGGSAAVGPPGGPP